LGTRARRHVVHTRFADTWSDGDPGLGTRRWAAGIGPADQLEGGTGRGESSVSFAHQARGGEAGDRKTVPPTARGGRTWRATGRIRKPIQATVGRRVRTTRKTCRFHRREASVCTGGWGVVAPGPVLSVAPCRWRRWRRGTASLVGETSPSLRSPGSGRPGTGSRGHILTNIGGGVPGVMVTGALRSGRQPSPQYHA